VPLVGVHVRVELAHLAKPDGHDAARHRLGDRPLVDRRQLEGAAIELAHRPRILQQSELVRGFLEPGCVKRLRDRDHRTGLDVGLTLGEGVQGVLRQAEIERQHILRRDVDPIGDREGAVLREGAVVEQQDEVAGLVVARLDRVAVTLREEPKVARLIVVDLARPRRVEDHGLAAAVDHTGPFGRDRVPVKLSGGAGIEKHVHARGPLADGELVDRGLLGPAAGRDLRNVALEGEAEVRHCADILGVVVGDLRPRWELLDVTAEAACARRTVVKGVGTGPRIGVQLGL
jgi:hypothetical protein